MTDGSNPSRRSWQGGVAKMETILIVDDEPVVLATLKDLLDMTGRRRQFSVAVKSM